MVLWYALFGKVTRSSLSCYNRSSVVAADPVCFCRVPRGEKIVLMALLANRGSVAWRELLRQQRTEDEERRGGDGKIHQDFGAQKHFRGEDVTLLTLCIPPSKVMEHRCLLACSLLSVIFPAFDCLQTRHGSWLCRHASRNR